MLAPGCRGKPAWQNKNRMQSIANLSEFAGYLRDLIRATPASETSWINETFGNLALNLFTLQCEHNEPYRRLCQAKGIVRNLKISDWKRIPAVPTSAFKDFELSSLPPKNRTTVFHSSGTTEQRPSRHFHNAESLAICGESLSNWFSRQLRFDERIPIICLTPPQEAAPHSSLVYMFEALRRKIGNDNSAFVGGVGKDGGWVVNVEAAVEALRKNAGTDEPVLILGTAFSFVHLLDYLAEKTIGLKLPAGSRVMETGGYKGRSRSLPKAELHQLICERFGLSGDAILCEYGMSELSSQAYDQPPIDVLTVSCSSRRKEAHSPSSRKGQSLITSAATEMDWPGTKSRRVFHFPPWARMQIISPETEREVNEGETGLIQIFDLANVFSVAAIQTEDLGIRRGDGFELVGRASLAEARGCSLMTV